MKHEREDSVKRYSIRANASVHLPEASNTDVPGKNPRLGEMCWNMVARREIYVCKCEKRETRYSKAIRGKSLFNLSLFLSLSLSFARHEPSGAFVSGFILDFSPFSRRNFLVDNSVESLRINWNKLIILEVSRIEYIFKIATILWNGLKNILFQFYREICFYGFLIKLKFFRLFIVWIENFVPILYRNSFLRNLDKIKNCNLKFFRLFIVWIQNFVPILQREIRSYIFLGKVKIFWVVYSLDRKFRSNFVEK